MKLKSTDWPYEQDEVTFYKVFACNFLTGKYTDSPCYDFQETKTNTFDAKVGTGIHVFETKEIAEQYKGLMTNSNFTKEELVIVPVTAEEEDLIAIGYQEGLRDIKTLCFKQVYLAREDYEKALTNTETEVQCVE
jgi:hypothetical protein